jgi:hypothetical protein
MEIKMPAPKKSLRPKARKKSIYGVGEMSTRSPDGRTIEEREASFARTMANKKAAMKPAGLKRKKDGGKLNMVKGPGGKMVPDYAADGVGKMAYGGKMKKVKKMGDGGMCRGMGAATRGGNYKMG